MFYALHYSFINNFYPIKSKMQTWGVSLERFILENQSSLHTVYLVSLCLQRYQFLSSAYKYSTWESLQSQKTDTCLSLAPHEYEPHARHKWSASLVRDYGTGRSIRYGSTLSHFLDVRNKYYNSSSSTTAYSSGSLMVISLAIQINVHIYR